MCSVCNYVSFQQFFDGWTEFPQIFQAPSTPEECKTYTSQIMKNYRAPLGLLGF